VRKLAAHVSKRRKPLGYQPNPLSPRHAHANVGMAPDHKKLT
jgi:hypothetical protein